MVPCIHTSQTPNGISIGSAMFCRAHERDQHTDTHTDRRTTLLSIATWVKTQHRKPQQQMNINKTEIWFKYCTRDCHESRMKHISPITRYSFCLQTNTVQVCNCIQQLHPQCKHLAYSTKHNAIFDSGPPAPLCDNMTSSTKQKDIMYCRKRVSHGRR